MELWVVFGLLVMFIISLFLGYFLSPKSINLSELIIFWMLYVITLSTVFIIFLSIYINYDLRNLKGPIGEEGEPGESGDKGEPGECEKDCKLHIPYNIVLFNVEKYLYILEEKNGDKYNLIKNKDLLERDKIKKLMNTKKIQDVYTEEHLKLLIDSCEKIFSHINEIDNSNERLELKNMYLKETIKRVVYSNQFKELEEYRGRNKLTEYISYVFLIWVKEIYDKSSIKYFITMGFEDDFKFYDKNPFDEIKKYDIFYWGISRKAKIRKISSKPLYKKKVEFKQKDGFQNPKENLNKSIEDTNKNHRLEKKEIKIIRSNDYVFSYNDTGSRLDESIACFKLKPKTVESDGKTETYYPLGDICVNRFGDKGENEKKKRIFGDYDSPSEKGEYQIGPNRDSILVNGSCFKEPTGYTEIWEDWLDQTLRHIDIPLIYDGEPQHAKYKGKFYKPNCESGYTSMGYSIVSTKNLDEDKLKESKNYQDKDGMPLTRNGPRCVRKDCIEEIIVDDSLKKEIWDTNDVPDSLNRDTGSPSYVGYTNNIQMYSLSPQTPENYNKHSKPTHSNAYHMITIQDDPFYRLKEDKIVKMPSKKTQGNTEKVNLDNVDISKIQSLKKKIEQLKKEQFSSTDNKTEEEIKKTEYEISILTQDLGWPLITKLDKTGELNEPSDKYTFYSPINPNDRDLQELSESSKVKKFIDKYNLIFLENNSFTTEQVNEISMNISILKNNLSKLECIHLISFIDSLPNIDKYINVFKHILEELYEKCNESHKISEKNNEYSFGLGYIYDKKTEIDNLKSQSNHNLFYIPNKGKLKAKNKNSHIIYFEKQSIVKNRELKQKMNTYYNDINIFTVTDKTDNPHPNVKIFLTMNDKEEYYLYDLDENKYLKLNDSGNLIGTTEIKKDIFELTS